MTPLPPQTPVQPPRYRFRPRSDHYTMPTFRAPMTPRVVEQPVETYDPKNEARPFEWSELRDPSVLVGGLLVFLAIVVFVVTTSLVDVTP